MAGFAWVTLATNDSYSLGALVLAHSLKQLGTVHQLAVLVTPGVTTRMREKLASIFDVIQEVDILNSKDEANLKLLQRPELGITFTKLHCWRLTQFDKCVFLDADTLVLQNCDELFERDEFSAAPDVGWPDCFNSGVYVYKPSNETYNNLIKFALEKGSFDGGDQGLLNLYFSDWAHKDISKHLPFIYNMCSTASYSYLPAFKQFGDNVKIVHFIGSSKPWLQYFDSETCQVHPSPGLQHLNVVLQRWWNIFCSLIHPNLSCEMARGRSTNVHIYSYETQTPYYNPSIVYDSEYFHEIALANLESNNDYTKVWDPWDDYKTENETQYVQKPDETSLTLEENVAGEDQNIFESHNKNDVVFQCTESHYHPHPQESASHPEHNTITSTINPEFPTSEIITPNNPIVPNPALQHISESTVVASESTLHEKDTEATDDAGLAGALAQMTLGAPRSPGQSALEDHLRRQGWEVGNIDYLGVDSFDNIWKKICETLASAPPPPPPPTSSESPKAREPTPPSAPQLEPIVAPAKTELQKPEETQKNISEKTAVLESVPVETVGKSVCEGIEQITPAEQIQSPPVPVIKDVEKTIEQTLVEMKETPKPVELPESQSKPPESLKVPTPIEQTSDKSVTPVQDQPKPTEPLKIEATIVDPPKSEQTDAPTPVGLSKDESKPAETPKDLPQPTETSKATPPQPTETPKATPTPVEQSKVEEPTKDSTKSAEPATDLPKAVEPPVDIPKPVEPPVNIPKPAAPPVDIPKPAEPPVDIPKPAEPPVDIPKPAAPPVDIPKPAEPPTDTIPKPVELPKDENKSSDTQKIDEPPKKITEPKDEAKPVELPKIESKPIDLPKEASKPPVDSAKDAPKEVSQELPKSDEHSKDESKPAITETPKSEAPSVPVTVSSSESIASTVTPATQTTAVTAQPSTPPAPDSKIVSPPLTSQECPLPKESPKQPTDQKPTAPATSAPQTEISETAKTPEKGDAAKSQEAPSKTPQESQKKEAPKSKPTKDTKKPETSTSGETTPGPTPPPRKGSGGAKKTKSKK